MSFKLGQQANSAANHKVSLLEFALKFCWKKGAVLANRWSINKSKLDGDELAVANIFVS